VPSRLFKNIELINNYYTTIFDLNPKLNIVCFQYTTMKSQSQQCNHNDSYVNKFTNCIYTYILHIKLRADMAYTLNCNPNKTSSIGINCTYHDSFIYVLVMNDY